MQRRMAAAETARASQTARWGAHVKVTVKLCRRSAPSAARSAVLTGQPLAKPSTSSAARGRPPAWRRAGPRAPGGPPPASRRCRLWPSTSSKGPVAPVTASLWSRPAGGGHHRGRPGLGGGQGGGAGRGPGPAAAGGRVQDELVDVPARDGWPSAVSTTWGPGPRVIPRRRPRRADRDLAVVEGRRSRAGDADRAGSRRWRAGWTWQAPGTWAAGRRGHRPGMPTSAMPRGRAGGGRVVVGRVLEADAGHGDADALAGRGGEGQRHRAGGPGDRASAMGGRSTRRAPVLGAETVMASAPSGGRRPPPAGQVVEGDRLGQVVLEPVPVWWAAPRTPAARRWPGCRRWRPRPRRRGRRAAGPWSRRRPRSRRPGPADQPVDLVVGEEGRDAGQPAEGEGAGGGQGELPADGGLGVRARRVGRDPLAGHDDGEPVGLIEAGPAGAGGRRASGPPRPRAGPGSPPRRGPRPPLWPGGAVSSLVASMVIRSV